MTPEDVLTTLPITTWSTMLENYNKLDWKAHQAKTLKLIRYIFNLQRTIRHL
jgi:hypothetical protein